MASRTDRRSRRATGGQQRAPAQMPSADTSALLSACALADTKVSEAPQSDVSILQLLGAIPSPARTYPGNGQLGGAQPHGIPCCPPPRTPMPLATPAALPPPPLAPVSNFEAGPSYRERLRAGGQGAFQRAYNVGLMPKSMRQEWSGACSMPPQADVQNGMVGLAGVQGMLSQQGDAQSGMLMPCMGGSDTQQMWNGAGQMQGHGDTQQMWSGAGQLQGHDYWYVPTEQSHVATHCPYTQSPELLQMMPMPDQQSVVTIPPQTLVQQPQVTTPTMINESPPTDLERCLAIIMPGSSQLPCDKDLMAAQLRAAADCQCYED